MIPTLRIALGFDFYSLFRPRPSLFFHLIPSHCRLLLSPHGPSTARSHVICLGLPVTTDRFLISYSSISHLSLSLIHSASLASSTSTSTASTLFYSSPSTDMRRDRRVVPADWSGRFQPRSTLTLTCIAHCRRTNRLCHTESNSSSTFNCSCTLSTLFYFFSSFVAFIIHHRIKSTYTTFSLCIALSPCYPSPSCRLYPHPPFYPTLIVPIFPWRVFNHALICGKGLRSKAHTPPSLSRRTCAFQVPKESVLYSLLLFYSCLCSLFRMEALPLLLEPSSKSEMLSIPYIGALYYLQSFVVPCCCLTYTYV